MLRPGTPEHSSLFFSLLLSLFSALVALQDSVLSSELSLSSLKRTLTHMRADSQGLPSPWGWPHSSAAPVKPSAGRGSDADRAHCLFPPPPLPPSLPSFSSTSRGSPSKGTKAGKERKGGKGRWELDEHCYDIVLESALSVFFFLFSFFSFYFLHYPFYKGLHTMMPLITFSLFLFSFSVWLHRSGTC